MDLDATDEQLDSPILIAQAEQVQLLTHLMKRAKDMIPLFDEILSYIPAPEVDTEGPMQYLVSAID